LEAEVDENGRRAAPLLNRISSPSEFCRGAKPHRIAAGNVAAIPEHPLAKSVPPRGTLHFSRSLPRDASEKADFKPRRERCATFGRK
jgi:hypothetical protein